MHYAVYIINYIFKKKKNKDNNSGNFNFLLHKIVYFLFFVLRLLTKLQFVQKHGYFVQNMANNSLIIYNTDYIEYIDYPFQTQHFCMDFEGSETSMYFNYVNHLTNT